MATEPVLDWTNDYDIFDPAYVEDPFPVWDELARTCPVAHTERWGGSWMPTRYEDVVAIAHDVEQFSSREITVSPPVPRVADDGVKAPPDHRRPARAPLGPPPDPARLLPEVGRPYEADTRELCRSLIDGFIDPGKADAAGGLRPADPAADHRPACSASTRRWPTSSRVGAGRPRARPAGPRAARRSPRDDLRVLLRRDRGPQRRTRGDDLITYLLAAEVDGQPVPDNHVLGTCSLLLIAGIDTTWSASAPPSGTSPPTPTTASASSPSPSSSRPRSRSCSAPTRP